MQERQIIKKIKELRQIKPNKDWVSLTKNRILGRGREKEVKVENWLFTPVRKPALVLAPLTMLAAVLGGLFVYFNFLPQRQMPIVSQIFKNQDSKKLVASLVQLQANLNKMTLALNNLKNSKDPSGALVMTEVIKATAKNGEKVIDQMKETSKSKKVLASLDGIGASYKELKEAAGDTQIKMAGDLIGDLKQRSLTRDDQMNLQKAEKYYNEGKIGQAIFFLTKIGK